MHPVDRLAPVMFRIDRSRATVFRHGWGDPVGIGLFDHPEVRSTPAPTIEIVWGRKEEHRGMRLRRGRFTSPLADHLPEAARVVTVDLHEPARGSDRLVILMPAWNDHGPAARSALSRLLADRGIASLIIEAPFLGTRRVRPTGEHPIGTVADFARMGAGLVLETRALIASLGARRRIGVSGYSMGGNLAALVAAVSPLPVAVAPLAASYSPGPVFTGAVMSGAVSWQTLSDGGGPDRLREVMDRSSVLALPPPPNAGSAVFVAGRRDGFVPLELTERLTRHWGDPELVVTDDGHATLLWRRKPVLVDAIVSSFDRAGGGTP